MPTKRIVDLLKGNCCIFIGAGIPNSIGFPLWDKLANDLVEYIWTKKKEFSEEKMRFSVKQAMGDLVKKGQPIKAITYCRDLLKEIGQEREYQVKLVEWLHDESKYRLANESTVYIQLKNILKKSVVLQTNLDMSIEKYCNIKAYSNTNLPRGESAPYLVYLHGIITDPSSWVMTTDEYNKYYQTDTNFTGFIQNIFQTSDVLFLGYSLNDKEILDQIAKVKGSGKQYVLVLEEIESNKSLNVVLENDLKHYGIVVVRYSVEKDGYEAFGSFLEQINLQLSPPLRMADPSDDGSKR